jgi:exosortase E/protease (VPEID-CTERM system)
VIGVGWVALAGSGEDGPQSAVWIAFRILGTVALVPVIEELFFRGYVLDRLDMGGLPMRILAVVVSSGLFGLMHDRIWAGAVAGVVFGLVYLWRGRVTDAIGAHIAANAVVALWAFVQSDWTLI